MRSFTNSTAAGRRRSFRIGSMIALGVIALLAASCSRDDAAEVTVQDTIGATSGVVPAAATVAAEGPEHEFIELSYYERNVAGSGSEPQSECEVAEPGVLVCTNSGRTGVQLSTIFGRVEHSGFGQTTIYLTQPCEFGDGQTGVRTVGRGGGTFVTSWGDEVYFRNQNERCQNETDNEGTGYWVVIGGTGRFQDASGTMSALKVAGEPNTSFGVMRVRADLWEDFVPSTASLISPGAVSVVEGDDGPVVVDVPVTLSHPSDEPITVDWATSDMVGAGVATADVDYVAATGTVTFAPGETSQTVPITVNGDTDVEPPLLYGEWGLVDFSNPSANAVLDVTELGSSGVFVIIDDD